MAHYVPAEEFREFNGALSKRKDTNRYCITRVKHVKDPITGEVVGKGDKEIFTQYRRNYKTAPLTPAEQAQRSRWREACREAGVIIRDNSHPRYMELYHRWRAQITANAHCKQFPNFVRAVLASEKREDGSRCS